MTNNRDWQVSYGHVDDCHGYRGPSTFLAGLNMARLTKRRQCARVWDMNSYDADWDDDAFVGTDTRTEDEDAFFLDCVTIGIKRRKMIDGIEVTVKRQLAEIERGRERLVKAWIAETGLLPSQSVLCHQSTINGLRVWVERKENENHK